MHNDTTTEGAHRAAGAVAGTARPRAAAGAIIIELLDARVRITVDGGADREAVTAVLALVSKVAR